MVFVSARQNTQKNLKTNVKISLDFEIAGWQENIKKLYFQEKIEIL
jgi:hypothetical protein